MTSAASQQQEEERQSALLEQCYTAINDKNMDGLAETYRSGLTQIDWPLRAALREEWLEGIRYLLTEQNAKPKAVEHLLFVRKLPSLDFCNLLAEYGVDFSKQDGGILAANLENREVVEWLLNCGIDINAGPGIAYQLVKGDYNNTCRVLNEAATLGDVELFEYLVGLGADPSRSIALHTVAECHDQVKTAEMMTHLLNKYHLDVNANEDEHELVSYGWTQSDTTLINAVRYRNESATKILVEHGAQDLDHAFSIAVEKDFEPAFKILLDGGANPTKCLTRIDVRPEHQESKLKASKLCLEYGGDPTPALLIEEVLDSEGHEFHHPPSKELKTLLEDAKARWDADGKETDYSEAKAFVRRHCVSGSGSRYRIPKVLQDM